MNFALTSTGVENELHLKEFVNGRNGYYFETPYIHICCQTQVDQMVMSASSCDRCISRMDRCPERNLFTIDHGQGRWTYICRCIHVSHAIAMSIWFTLNVLFLHASKPVTAAIIKLDVATKIAPNESASRSRKLKIFKLFKNLHCVVRCNSGK